MKIYLTGSTGFVGKNIKEQIKGEYYCFKREDDVELTLRTFNPDYIIHCAAEIYEEEEMFWSNTYLTYILLKHSINLPFKAFIYIGTSSEYGLKRHPIKEDELLEPITLYAATKASSTLLAQTYAKQYKKPVMIARPFSLYGKHEPYFRFIPTAIKCLKTEMTLPVAPGSHDFIYIDDFINGIRKMMDKPQIGEIYNFCTGTQYTNMEVALELSRISGKPLQTKSVKKMRTFDTDYWMGDNTKARIELNWKPEITLEEGLKQLI